jgi:ABC-2 type transport system permease protein
MPGVAAVYRHELVKLRFQKRTYLGLGAAIAVPLIFVAALALQSGQPNDVAFGRYVRQSGLAIPLVLLIFGAIWLFPLITALVAGDIVAAEDHNGTLKTILTRSVDRGRILTGKLLAAGTYAAVAIALMGATAIVAGSFESGFNSLTSLSGTQVSAGRALLLVLASLGVYLLPILALACIGVLLSVVARNSAGAVVGTLMFSLGLQLVGILPGLGGVRPYLLTEQFQAWQGLLRIPADLGPLWHAAWLCPLYAACALVPSYVVFVRRDVPGG